MLKILRGFLLCKKGNIVENIIYIIIMGALAFTFYSTHVKEPMEQNMGDLNTQIQSWTAVGSGE